MSEDRFRDETDNTGRDEARSWIVLLASGKVTVEESATFKQWYAAHPAHARAFAEAKQHWEVVGQAAQDLASDAAYRTYRRRRLRTSISRRGMLVAGAATVAGIGVVAVRPPFGLWSPFVDFTADYRTGIGETKTIAMGQAVTVQLSTRSRLSIQSDGPDGLRVALLAGEVAVASGAWPVTLVAGHGATRATSGRFNLRNDDDIVRVTCLDGTVDVFCGDQRIALRADQQARYSAQGLAAPTTADPDEISAWQRGILVFRNQPLRYVVDEVNRYRPGKIVLLNHELGNCLVAVANFHLNRLDEVISQVEVLYGATARRLPGGIVLLS